MVEVAGFQAPVPSSLKTGWSYYSMNSNIENTKSRVYALLSIYQVSALHGSFTNWTINQDKSSGTALLW